MRTNSPDAAPASSSISEDSVSRLLRLGLAEAIGKEGGGARHVPTLVDMLNALSTTETAAIASFHPVVARSLAGAPGEAGSAINPDDPGVYLVD